MDRDDWIGLGVSAVLHVLVLVLVGMVVGASPDPERLGYIQVEFGPLAEGRPVQQAEQNRPDTSEQSPEEETEEEAEPQTAPPEEARPVDLPDQPEADVEEERVQAQEAETVTPEERASEAVVEASEPEEPQPAEPRGGGDPEGTSGADQGDEGAGSEETEAAPFQIEGLTRTPQITPLPRYAEKVNATIRMRITVDPSGRIVQRIPLMKANPALEQAVMEALQRWRFNPLPPNAPQQNQTGTVTFRFRLD